MAGAGPTNATPSGSLGDSANSPSGESSASAFNATAESPQPATGDSTTGGSTTGGSTTGISTSGSSTTGGSATGNVATGDSDSGEIGNGDTPSATTSVSKLESGDGAASAAADTGTEQTDESGGQTGDSKARAIPTIEPPPDRLATNEPIPDFAAADSSDRAGGTRGKSSTFGLLGDRAKDGRYSPIVPNVVIRDLAGKVVYRGEIDLRDTLKRIDAGTKLSFPNDGSVFQNREQLLPKKAAGHYREWVHRTPGLAGPGPQRVVTGANGEAYYTSDHYGTFRRVR
ncbi:MAG: ribonuclease domain-containing protein [Planctomycetota bacterium]